MRTAAWASGPMRQTWRSAIQLSPGPSTCSVISSIRCGSAVSSRTAEVSRIRLHDQRAMTIAPTRPIALDRSARVVTSATAAASMITVVQASLDNVSASLSRLGTSSKAFSMHQSFVSKLQDTIDAGVGNLVDADLAKESAKFQALQTKQQLGIQALSIANQAPQSILSLFK